MKQTTRPHPRLPFIVLHIEYPDAEDLAAWEAAQAREPDEYIPSPDSRAWASITHDGDNWQLGFGGTLVADEDEEATFQRLALAAERDFFRERDGAFLHLRQKAQEAAASGDLTTLCLLAEGFGYWRAITEANRRAVRAVASSLDTESAFPAESEPLSFFSELAQPPTILASYHEQRGERAKADA
jgi:hypothetical protein